MSVSREVWRRLDQQLKRVDEDRWLSSRYAPAKKRRALIALYALHHELARVQTVVSEPTLGAIRFQWWRETLDPTATDYPRRHDGAMALAACVTDGLLPLDGLQRLVDRFEAAFEAGDRSMEPDGTVAALAAKALAPAQGWSQHIRGIARHYAALKRGEDVGVGTVVPPAPGDVRPAIAHFRLRWRMGEGRPFGRFDRRWTVLKSILDGRV